MSPWSTVILEKMVVVHTANKFLAHQEPGSVAYVLN
jgi:hypothetical protein